MSFFQDQPTIPGKQNIYSKQKSVCATLKKYRLEAIQKLQPQKTAKGCRSFAGMVNFLSMFCPELQKLLKPIYNLTRKGRPFNWGKEQQDSFEKIKQRLIKPPVLHMPNKTGRFHLYSDTSKFATGSALYQIQNGKPKLIAYPSKRLPEAMKSYSITELELCGLAINMILSDFLSQLNNHDSNPNEIIPISFDMYKILENNLENFCDDKYLIQM